VKKSTIALQMYTLRDYAKTPENLKETFHRVRQIGYEAVQISGIGPIDPLQVKELADEAGLAICATHVSYERLLTDLDMVAAEHKLWNCSYVGVGSIPDRYRTGVDGYLTFAHEASAVSKMLKDRYGLQFIYHNHHFEFERFDGRTGMDILFEETDPEAFGFELDLYWVQAGGANPLDWIRKVNGRMGVVHLKDMAIVSGVPTFAEIGEGNMNYSEIIRLCRETGVEWFVVEQDACNRDPFDSIAISLRNLHKEL
jgi:sugar phosphate isomerase/epimerase